MFVPNVQVNFYIQIEPSLRGKKARRESSAMAATNIGSINSHAQCELLPRAPLRVATRVKGTRRPVAALVCFCYSQ